MAWLKDKKIWGMLLLYGALALVFHVFFLKLGGGDDYYFMTCLEDTDFGSFLLKRWNGWSSRLVIEGVLVLTLQQPIWVWRTLDILVSLLIAFLLTLFFFRKQERSLPAILLFFCLLISYDFRELDSAGWMTTTINYWWALAAALVAALPLYYHYADGAVRKWLYLPAAIGAVFALNHEQICVLALCGCVYLLAADRVQKRKTLPWLYALLGLSLISLACILLCPGNEVRSLSNIEYWFPAYADFSLLQKGLLGWYSLLKTLYQDMNWTYTLFTALLCAAVFYRRKELLPRLAALVPLASNLGLLGLLALSKFRDYGPVHQILHAFDFDQPIVYYQGFLPWKYRLLLLVYTLCCLCVVLSLFFLWGWTSRTADSLALLFMAAASKVSMGMSPTVWASSERTSLFLDFGFVFLGMFCVREFLARRQKGRL